MLFTCDIGNSTIKIGVFTDDKLIFTAAVSSDTARTSDEYAIILSGLFAMNSVPVDQIEGAVISSVAKPLTLALTKAVEKLMQVKPLLLGPGVKTGLNIKTDIPSQLGADLVANAVGSLALIPAPLAVLSMGTATTITGINGQGELCGVLIAPGMLPSLNALAEQTAELPKIALSSPGPLLGRNTVDSMVSGIIYGSAAMVEGLLDQIAGDWGLDRLEVVVTGSQAVNILPHLSDRHEIHYQPDLTLNGLRLIYALNRQKKNRKAKNS